MHRCHLPETRQCERCDYNVVQLWTLWVRNCPLKAFQNFILSSLLDKVIVNCCAHIFMKEIGTLAMQVNRRLSWSKLGLTLIYVGLLLSRNISNWSYTFNFEKSDKISSSHAYLDPYGFFHKESGAWIVHFCCIVILYASALSLVKVWPAGKTVDVLLCLSSVLPPIRLLMPSQCKIILVFCQFSGTTRVASS